MTIGVGGKSIKEALASLTDMSDLIEDITVSEYQQRIANAQNAMRENQVAAIFISPSSNLIYFTGIQWRASERLLGVIIPLEGPISYVVPHFELSSFSPVILVQGRITTWQENEDPYDLVIKQLILNLKPEHYQWEFGLCGAMPNGMASKLSSIEPGFNFGCADKITEPLRQVKSPAEIKLIKRAMEMTVEVQKAAASILYEGISSKEVVEFIDEAHKKVGAPGSYFCLVLFAEASAIPHGIKGWQTLKNGDMVLIDTGCKFRGYTSDITRSYVFGTPSDCQRQVWDAEKLLQEEAFKAAKLHHTCASVDQRMRDKLKEIGLGQNYDLPGVPHRTGHGIGLDIHEGPYLVGGDNTKLRPGMCFSNEPTICLPGQFGVRLEDHFYLTKSGARWFTKPSKSIDDPFG